jgi:hypothetical protein
MELNMQIQETLVYLNDNKKRLILEIIKNFLPDDEVMPDDLYYIELAEKELANGESVEWSDIEWK